MMSVLKARRPINFCLLYFLILLSCNQDRKSRFYYAFSYEDNVPEYILRTIRYEEGFRIEELSFYNSELVFKHKEKERYKVIEGGLNKVILRNDTAIVKPYLTTINKDCIEYLYEDAEVNDIWSTKYCFLGNEDISINGKIYKNAYKFKKKKGNLDGVESMVYYDSDLILLKEEYVSGYTDKYRIIRLDTVMPINNQ